MLKIFFFQKYVEGKEAGGPIATNEIKNAITTWSNRLKIQRRFLLNQTQLFFDLFYIDIHRIVKSMISP